MSSSKIKIDLQIESDHTGLPGPGLFEKWVRVSMLSDFSQLEQTIRIVDESESRQLNQTYRHKNNPTNVLSFPAECSDYLDYKYLGDLVICSPVVKKEAIEQNKSLFDHWAHMVVHGMLHLQGYDHLTESDAEKMEAVEIDILAKLGHTNPYRNIENKING